MNALWILLFTAVVLGMYVMRTYNTMVRSRNLVDEGWSGIDVQLKRRNDLIGNLVETVKGYAKHEREVFERVTEARAAAVSAGSVTERAQAENALTGTLRSLFAVAENYPELKANTNFLDLQQNLGTLESEIQMARRYYNGAARAYNSLIQVFPNNMLAGPFGFTKRDYFEAAEEDRSVPKVSF
ncbi:MAG: LemA family protein [Thermovirgaceae bacterium]|nr:LemA family protein [Thermovirgaceae bacterium]